MSKKLQSATARCLKHYVYIYVDPRDGAIFYVGKGKGNRAFVHLDARGESRKGARIREIRKAGLEPSIEVLVHGMESEETAMKVEAAIIDLLGTAHLTNEVRGYHSRSHGRMTLDQIRATYSAKDIEIQEPTVLIRINRRYRHSMTPLELYEATRAYWRVGTRRHEVRLAMAVYEGIVREVYEVAAWFPAHTTFTDRVPSKRSAGRYEFVGRIATEETRKKYLHGSVRRHIPAHSQNPIIYVGLERKPARSVRR